MKKIITTDSRYTIEEHRDLAKQLQTISDRFTQRIEEIKPGCAYYERLVITTIRQLKNTLEEIMVNDWRRDPHFPDKTEWSNIYCCVKRRDKDREQ